MAIGAFRGSVAVVEQREPTTIDGRKIEAAMHLSWPAGRNKQTIVIVPY
jgi:hypothetical protein